MSGNACFKNVKWVFVLKIAQLFSPISGNQVNKFYTLVEKTEYF